MITSFFSRVIIKTIFNLIFQPRLIKTGFKRNLTRGDIWDVDTSESAEYVSNRLATEWDKVAKM